VNKKKRFLVVPAQHFHGGKVTSIRTSRRQLSDDEAGGYVALAPASIKVKDTYIPQRFLSEEETAEAYPHALLLNATGLPSECKNCTLSIALSESSECDAADAHSNALEFPLQAVLTYITNEMGSTGGWVMKKFRELQNSTLPVSLAEFITSAADESSSNNTDTDYNLAVYLYDMEKNPVACATLKPVANEEEVAKYEALFEELNGEEGSDATTTTLGAEKPSSGGLKLIHACVIGMSVLMSAILLVSA